MRTVGIIPARYQSTRLPGKPLADIGGTSMVMRVYKQALKADLDQVIVATDDPRILNHVNQNGGSAIMTSANHLSGTDRVLEAALQCEINPQAIINIQGDEPFIEPRVINELVNLLKKSEVSICTLIKEFNEQKDIVNPNRVKVEIDSKGKALSFSRKILNENTKKFQHLGIYGYKLNTLKTICALPPSPLELSEKLEQLRWLENGHDIHTTLVQEDSICIDTPED